MKIQAGKSYRTRKGERVDITKVDGTVTEYPVVGIFHVTRATLCWTEAGRFYYRKAFSPHDLVSLWDEPEAKRKKRAAVTAGTPPLIPGKASDAFAALREAMSPETLQRLARNTEMDADEPALTLSLRDAILWAESGEANCGLRTKAALTKLTSVVKALGESHFDLLKALKVTDAALLGSNITMKAVDVKNINAAIASAEQLISQHIKP